jgi:hypothetical protein
MTEAEWLACEDPIAMLHFLRGRVSDRKLRLYCCACCRLVWHQLRWNRRKAVAIAERYADGKAGWWGTFLGEALSVHQNPGLSQVHAERAATYLAVSLWGKGPRTDGVAYALEATRYTRGSDANDRTIEQTHLIRDLVGTLPFQVVNIPPEWRTTNVLALSRTIYEERAFDRMPILGDALMDAGCTHDEVLAHCQSLESHIRGCWVLDLALDRK